MDYYYVNENAQNNRDHEVHKSNCSYLPDAKNLKGLGYFSNCADAVKEAKKLTLNLMDVIIVVMLVIVANKLLIG
jgi:hypothetical protein